MPSISTKPPFEYISTSEAGVKKYKMDSSKLSSDKCHMFFPVILSEEILISAFLEHMNFHPKDEKMRHKFNVVMIKWDEVPLFWCTFPKEYRDTCGKAGKVFDMTMKNSARIFHFNKTSLEFPADDKLICFQGKRGISPETLKAKHLDCFWQSKIESSWQLKLRVVAIKN